MSGQDPRPTPVSGMPAAAAATPEATTDNEILAPKSAATLLILSAIDDLGRELRSEVGALRDESRARHRELAAADDTTKHEVRRLERRIEEVEQQLRDDRTARDRENEARLADQRARDQTKLELTAALDGFRRHAEQVAKASSDRDAATAAREEAAVKRYEEAAQKMDAAVASVGELTERVTTIENTREDDRTAQADRDRLQDERFGALVATQRRIARELDVEPIEPGDEKGLAEAKADNGQQRGRIRALTRQQKVAVLLLILGNLSTALVYWLAGGRH